MSIWKRLRKTLSPAATVRAYYFDDSLRASLRAIALEESRTEEEVAADLLKFALGQQRMVTCSLDRWQNLSAREQQVAALICLDYTTRDIAQKLVISPETVKSHTHNILQKFSLRRKAELKQALAGWDFSAWEM